MAIEAVWDKLKKQKAKSDALPKRDPGGFVSKSLREPGESFMDFTKRRHEVLYPGAQQMARQAGVGGFRAFGPAHQAYQNQLRARMGKAPGARYNSQDWQRMMAGLNPSTYPAGAAQVGGAPPGRPPLPTSMGNVLGAGPRPIGSGPYNVLGPGPSSVPRNVLGHPRPPSPVQVDMGRGRRWPNTPPPGFGTAPQFSMDDLERMQRQSIATRRPTPSQVPMGSGQRMPYNVLGGQPAPVNPFAGMSQEQIDTINRNDASRMQRQASNILNRLSPERRHQLGLLGGMETRGLQRPF